MIVKLNAPESEVEITKHWKYIDKVYVSVVCTTFNQEIYIRDAIESFLAQETEYKFEIIIHDDASTDSTPQIVQEYKDKYPNIIRTILQTENQYSIYPNKPFFNCVEMAKGEYIAICEGDDFWIEKGKIEQQCIHLENNTGTSLVHTDCYRYIQETSTLAKCNVAANLVTTKSLLLDNEVRTLVTMTRREYLLDFIIEHGKFSKNWLLGDWPLWIYLSIKGRVIKLNGYMGVYRVLPESASHFKDNRKAQIFQLSTIELRYYFVTKYDLSYKGYISDLYTKQLIKLNKHVPSNIEGTCSFKGKIINYIYKNPILKHALIYILRKKVYFDG